MTILKRMIEIQKQTGCAFVYEHYNHSLRHREFFCYHLIKLKSSTHRELIGDLLSIHADEHASVEMSADGTFDVKLFLQEHPSELDGVPVDVI